jgi:hypothetical protein
MPGGQLVPFEQIVQSISPGESVKLRFRQRPDVKQSACQVAPVSGSFSVPLLVCDLDDAFHRGRFSTRRIQYCSTVCKIHRCACVSYREEKRLCTPWSSLKMADDASASPGSCSRTPPSAILIVNPFVGPIAICWCTVVGTAGLPGPWLSISGRGLLKVRPSSVLLTVLGIAPLVSQLLPLTRHPAPLSM